MFQASKYLLVESSSPFSVNVLMFGSCSSYVALPQSSLGTVYYVSMKPPAPGTADRSLIAATAVEDGTTVDINLETSSETYVIYCQPWSITGKNITTAMNRGDTLVLASDVDLSGSRVSADRPVAVAAGSAVGSVFIANQLLPVSSWGRTYFAPALDETAANDYDLKFNTQNDPSSIVYLNGNPVRSYGTRSASACLNASEPFQVVQSSVNVVGVPLTTFLLPAIDHFRSSYSVFVPSVVQLAGNTHRILIVVPDSGGAGLLLDGTSITNGIIWTSDVPMCGYLTGYIVVLNGYHRLEHSDGMRFGAILYSTDGGSCAFGYSLAFGQIPVSSTIINSRVLRSADCRQLF